MRIEKISRAQIARFGEWSKKWIEIGLSTDPTLLTKHSITLLQ